MKEIKKKTVALLMFAVLIVATFASCSKNEDEPQDGATENPADLMVGTYEGKLILYPGSTEHFNAQIIVTKESDSRIKVVAKSGTAYSSMTPKIIGVKNLGEIVNSVGNDPAAYVVYNIKDKNVAIITSSQAANDVTVTFNGTKK